MQHDTAFLIFMHKVLAQPVTGRCGSAGCDADVKEGPWSLRLLLENVTTA